ncbi:hypothetical protein AOCH_007682, partial [Aspergillus ochraceoroseus]
MPSLLATGIILLLLAIPAWAILTQTTSNPSSTIQRLLRKPGILAANTPQVRDTSEVVALHVYPIKSCRGLALPRTKLCKSGLELDRRWMVVDAETHVFLTIRQIAEMTLITTALSEDGEWLVISVPSSSATATASATAPATVKKEITIPAHPSPTWLENNTTLSSRIKIWDTVTDGYVYGAEVNSVLSAFLARDVALVYKGPAPRILQGNGAPRVLGRTQSTNFPDVHPVLIASEASVGELNARLAAQGEEPVGIERFRANIVVPNVHPDTAQKHRTQPWDTLMKYRRVDEGMKYKPCFGMLSAPRNEGEIRVGMKFEVLEETNQH